MKLEYFILFILCLLMLNCESGKDPSKVTLVQGAKLFQNGQWAQKDFYIYDTIMKFKNTAPINDTVLADGKYITPGFVEGHTHNLDRAWQRSYVDKYLSEGITVVRNMTSKSNGVAKFREYLQTRPSPRVLYANWGFTSTLGHPFMAYEPYTIGLRNREDFKKNSKRLDTSRVDLYNSYAFVDSISQLKDIWPRYLKTDPDLVKIYYFNEDGIKSRKKGTYGLKYEVAKAIIDSAHAADLKVHAHIGNAEEFEKMLDAGVDGFAHTPEFSWEGDSNNLSKYYLTDDMLRKASEKNAILNPTATINYARNKNDSILLQKIADLQTDMIKRYRALGGSIVPGTDFFAQTSQPLLDYYAKYIDLPADELVSIFTEEATEALFNDPNFGKLESGSEATFLIFDEKPFSNETWKKPKTVFLKGEKVK